MRILLFVTLLMGMVFISRAQSTDGMVDAIGQMGQDEVNNISQQAASDATVNSSIGDALGHLNTFMGIARDAQALYNSSRSLGNGECSPDFSTNSNAMMPSSCTTGECRECYTRAVNELTFVRRQLGRLSCIYQNTKNFNNSAIAFGDNASGIHAVTGLAWQNARGEIVAEFRQFQGTYDAKYRDLIGALENALKGIDACERQFGQPDWYQRFGFMYFEFMQDKYKRTD